LLTSKDIVGVCTNRENITTPKAIDCIVHQKSRFVDNDSANANVTAPHKPPHAITACDKNGTFNLLKKTKKIAVNHKL
jgi:hypothetical protein